MTDEIIHQIHNSDLILAGIGKEWEETYDRMREDAFYSALSDQLPEDKKEAQAQLQYLQYHFLIHHPDQRKAEAYNKLAGFMKDKNYFLVSICTDDAIYRSDLTDDRIVTPCGGFHAQRCADGCDTGQGLLTEDMRIVEQVMGEIDVCGGDLGLVDFPVCAACGRTLVFNQIAVQGYKEEGYLLQWDKYTKWLSGTLNRKVCILELGAGMEYPSVIRFPFEKVAYFNQKASFVRVHSRLYQLPAEVKERGMAVCADSVDFVLN